MSNTTCLASIGESKVATGALFEVQRLEGGVNYILWSTSVSSPRHGHCILTETAVVHVLTLVISVVHTDYRLLVECLAAAAIAGRTNDLKLDHSLQMVGVLLLLLD